MKTDEEIVHGYATKLAVNFLRDLHDMRSAHVDAGLDTEKAVLEAFRSNIDSPGLLRYTLLGRKVV